MKNSEIHNCLDKKEIRDFLSLSLVKSFESEMQNKKEEIPYDNNPEHTFLWAIKDTEAQIKYLQRSLEILKMKEAIIQVIHASGWEEFDVSDITTKDLPYRLKMNFIGTANEYHELVENIENS